MQFSIFDEIQQRFVTISLKNMKLLTSIIIPFIAFLLGSCTSSKDHNEEHRIFNETQTFFSTDSPSGLYHYENLSHHQPKIDTIIAHYLQINTSEVSTNFRKAYFLNLYELLFMKQLANHYPTHYITDINDFFSKKVITLDNKEYSLNTLRIEKIKPLFQQPDYLLLIPYGGYSDHNFDGMAFKEHNFEIQKSRKLGSILNHPTYIRVKPKSKLILLPELFNWFKNEFKSEEEIRKFINTYRTSPLPESYNIQYYPWSWKID